MAALLAVSASLTVAPRAESGANAWSAYLAPASTCAGASARGASPDVQRRAITCLLNWARARVGQRKLSGSRSLERAAGHKGTKVVSCRQLSHTPCGSAATTSVDRAGYRYSTFGENIFAGGLGSFSARDVVGAWLRSATHRANILRAGFSEIGTARVYAHSLVTGGMDVVWVAEFASPR